MSEIELREYVTEKIQKYCKKLDIELPQAIIFDHDIWEQKYLNGNKIGKFVAGQNYKNGQAIFINLKPEFKSALDNTIAHEIVHTVEPHLDHGFIFTEYIRQIVNGVYKQKISAKKLFKHYFAKLLPAFIPLSLILFAIFVIS